MEYKEEQNTDANATQWRHPVLLGICRTLTGTVWKLYSFYGIFNYYFFISMGHTRETLLIYRLLIHLFIGNSPL